MKEKLNIYFKISPLQRWENGNLVAYGIFNEFLGASTSDKRVSMSNQHRSADGKLMNKLSDYMPMIQTRYEGKYELNLIEVNTTETGTTFIQR